MDRPALAVVIPAGPSDDILDTVASVVAYTEAPRLIVVVDDGINCKRAALESFSSDVHVMRAPDLPHGTLGNLWMKLGAGYQYALENCYFDVLLRLDADALLIGPGIAEAAAKRFESESDLGLIGSYRVGPDGGLRNWTEAATVLSRECGLRGLDRPRMRRMLREIRSEAKSNGYVGGAQVLGGAYIHSRDAALALKDRGWLDISPLRQSHLGEDQLATLLTVAAGFKVSDYGGPEDPLALRWKGLPSSPQDLLERQKLVVHSVRFWEDMKESEIRAVFAHARQLHNSETKKIQ